MNVIWLSSQKIHRGYQDGSGLFTLEQCQKDDAEPRILHEGAQLPDDAPTERCEFCFPDA